MRKMTRRRRLLTVLTAVTMGGATFQLGSCPQEVRSTVLEGLGGASNALILSLVAAMFDGLEQMTDEGDLTGSSI